MWEDLARLAASSLFKGNQVYVRGKLGIESYQPANGPLRETMQVRALSWSASHQQHSMKCIRHRARHIFSLTYVSLSDQLGFKFLSVANQVTVSQIVIVDRVQPS